ncbi:MAG: DUF3795 domain-containing protein [Elusimicrobiota bacterium]
MILPESLTPNLVAPCGMNCGICLNMFRDGKCEGCNGDERLKTPACARCRIKKCGKLKVTKSGFCYECNIYPCARVQHLDKRYRTKYGMSMIDNLSYIKKYGLDKFVRYEKRRWKCPSCGELLCVHRDVCQFCGKKITIRSNLSTD